MTVQWYRIAYAPRNGAPIELCDLEGGFYPCRWIGNYQSPFALRKGAWVALDGSSCWSDSGPEDSRPQYWRPFDPYQ